MKNERETLQEVRRHDRQQASLRTLARAQVELLEVNERIDKAARTARRNGASWASIGRVIGVSRQAAEQRYGK